ncbi:MarR family transcriptional regulator [Methanolobus sp. ZRKC2]|uniref:MarR family winged helix-turn-helix transcriptional regulator n=1 Tax=Methanolobus sp. ZRKC2 TaxID=3125783 RepID=UPI003249A2D6
MSQSEKIHLPKTRTHESIGREATLLSREIHIFLARELEPYGIGSGQFPFLMRLLHHDGISQESLTRALNCDRATGTRALNKLEEKGYVRRDTDPRDKRAYCVFLTEKSSLLEPVIRKISSQINDVIFRGFTDDEKVLFLSMITRALDNIATENDARKGGK